MPRPNRFLRQPPPSYYFQTESIASGSIPSSAPPSDSATFKTKPTNFLFLSNEHDTIRGEFVIDPCMRIPSSMLPPLGENETEDDRKNLCLSSRNSSVNAEMWLLGPGVPTSKPRRTTVVLTSGHGSIRAQLVHPFSSRRPYDPDWRASCSTPSTVQPRFH